MNLSTSEKREYKELLPLSDAQITYYPNLFKNKANYYFKTLYDETPWQQDDIKLFGKIHKQPRLTALYGNEGKTYTYSNITMQSSPFTSTLIALKKTVEAVTGTSFNVVLLNLYRSGQDSNGWHSDNEKELGKNPVIASVSFGAKRKFKLRHTTDKTLRHDMELENGSLLVMEGPTQQHWQHQIPKTQKTVNPRINLTFRFIH